ncbi:hypothetical protein CKO_04980 [Citrobacter koseri ATCC BAA-895]|uniref:Uncharacterized protein n=1 Tax=Citrobacter koseri (strain ATCC BAA-895 / CDC 4225-83 / SGSC4696) TaxID=290338 RepID=A8ARB1_CITK8|nr:hypothetical protein CKO_04980 [Citrobacter koseri ATCC BAA-895]
MQGIVHFSPFRYANCKSKENTMTEVARLPARRIDSYAKSDVF